MRTEQVAHLSKLVLAAMIAGGVLPVAVENYPGEGFVVRVQGIKAVFAAEAVARDLESRFGFDVLVAN